MSSDGANQSEVEEPAGVRAGRCALPSRMADVALVPQCDVLEADRGVPAQQPGDAGDVLRADWVALVGHRR